MKLKFTDGYIIFIESDDKNGWYFAKPWVRQAFFEAINPNTLKSLDVMKDNEIIKDFSFGCDNYKLKIYLDESEAYLYDKNKKITNRLCFFYINKQDEKNNNKLSKFMIENL